MAFCLLSHIEARQLERERRVPDCRDHRHIPAKIAHKLVADGAHRLVGDRDVRITPCMPKDWTGANSACARVMQMKPVWRDKRRQATRRAIPAPPIYKGHVTMPSSRVINGTV